MKIFNTLTRKKEEFIPLEEGVIKMYVCGPTVYNLIHIGNARPMVVFDTFRRYMTYKGYKVDFVSNFTDVDDKIIKAAAEEQVGASEISERYIAECRKDMEGLNVLPATVHPKATEEIDSMIDMIGGLIGKDRAYAAKDGTVYFRTRNFPGYGKLSHKNIDDLEAGHGRELKVTGDEGKEDYLDFVLWKPKKEGEPFWKSPWCDGRPGWHIECSCMARKYLGDTIDIHAGGEDLIFPHHENEIAQSESATGKPFARYWMHNGFLNINNNKMSKSLGNFFTVRDIAEKYDLRVLRFFMLTAHYRSPLNYSEEIMQSARASLERILTAADRISEMCGKNTGALSGEEREQLKHAASFQTSFDEAMDEDLNTADAITALFDLVKFINTTASESSSAEYVTALKEEMSNMAGILGLRLEREETVLDADIEKLIEERQEARKQKNFARADEIRNQLLSMGIILKDTRDGVRWKRAD